MVLDQILQESFEAYSREKSKLAARLLTLPRGSLVLHKTKTHNYYYLHKKVGESVASYFIGEKTAPLYGLVVRLINERKKTKQELNLVITYLKRLRKNIMITQINTMDLLSKIFKEFADNNLWESGIELIGTWCFNAYSNFYKLNAGPNLIMTSDVDMLVKIPYTGPEYNIDRLLSGLGFVKEFKEDMSVYYSGSGMYIEFLTPTENKNKKVMAQDEPKLRIRPEPVEMISILLNNPTSVEWKSGEKIVLPSMPSFMIQKMMIACTLMRSAKRKKDHGQIIAVAEYIARNKPMLEETKKICKSLTKNEKHQVCITIDDVMKKDRSGAVKAIFHHCRKEIGDRGGMAG